VTVLRRLWWVRTLEVSAIEQPLESVTIEELTLERLQELWLLLIVDLEAEGEEGGVDVDIKKIRLALEEGEEEEGELRKKNNKKAEKGQKVEKDEEDESEEGEEGEEFVVSMEEELKCPVCRRVYTKPVLLPCSHSLCVACALSLQEPAANHLPQTTLEDGTPLPSDQISLLDFPDMDKLSIVSETDSGVVCNSRPSSYVGTPSVANIFIQSLQSCSWAIRCLVCQRLVFLEDSGALSLPCNRALECIVDKYYHRKKVQAKCDKCLDGGEGSSSSSSSNIIKAEAGKEGGGSSSKKEAAAATVMCAECEIFYCDACRDAHHPATGAMSKHNLVDPTQGISMRSRKQQLITWRDQKCTEHREDRITMYCMSCRLPVCGKCATDGRHMNHEAHSLGVMVKSQKVGTTIHFTLVLLFRVVLSLCLSFGSFVYHFPCPSIVTSTST
jgi:hypothetical protein